MLLLSHGACSRFYTKLRNLCRGKGYHAFIANCDISLGSREKDNIIPRITNIKTNSVLYVVHQNC
jgi:hypothetical protein